MKHKRLISAFAFAAGVFLSTDAFSSRHSVPEHADIPRRDSLAQIDPAIKKEFLRNGYEVMGDAGWSCYHVERIPDREKFSGCVNMNIAGSALTDDILQPNIYRIAPEL